MVSGRCSSRITSSVTPAMTKSQVAAKSGVDLAGRAQPSLFIAIAYYRLPAISVRSASRDRGGEQLLPTAAVDERPIERGATKDIGGESLLSVVLIEGLLPVDGSKFENAAHRPGWQQAEQIAQVGPGFKSR